MTTQETRTLQFAALDELAKYDHAFIAPEGVKAICQPFGFEGHIVKVKTNPNDPTGLSGYNGETELEGADAVDVAKDICRKLGIRYDLRFGRGSQLRECIHAAKEFLLQEQINSNEAFQERIEDGLQ